MKKYILIMIISSLFFVSCTKTDVDVELENSRNSEELLTDEENEILQKEDPEFAEDYLRELNDAVEENKLNEDIKLVEELEELENLKKSWEWSKFSCDMVLESSVCIEYYGSFWTAEQVKIWCKWIFSEKKCPSDYIWWCNTWEWTMADMVTWMYLRWNWGMTNESIKNAKNACNATLMASWITK